MNKICLVWKYAVFGYALFIVLGFLGCAKTSSPAKKVLVAIDVYAIEDEQRVTYHKITVFETGEYLNVNIQGESLKGKLTSAQARELMRIADKQTHGTWSGDAQSLKYEVNLSYLSIVHEPKMLELIEVMTQEEYFSDFFSDKEGSWEEQATEAEELFRADKE